MQQGELLSPDHTARLIVERRVHGDHIRLCEQQLKRLGGRGVERAKTIGRNVGIPSHDLHAEGVRSLGDLAADPAEPHDSQQLALHFAAGQAGPFPAALVHRHVSPRQMAQQGEHAAKEEFGHGDRVAGGRIDDRDAKPGGVIHRDIVDPDSRSAHHLQSGAGREQLGRNVGGRAPDDRVVGANAVDQLGGGQGVDNLDIKLFDFLEQFDAGRIDMVGHEDLVGHVAALPGPLAGVPHVASAGRIYDLLARHRVPLPLIAGCGDTHSSGRPLTLQSPVHHV